MSIAEITAEYGIQELRDRIFQLEKENKDARCLIWCLIKALGGRIQVPENLFLIYRDDSRIEKYHSEITYSTIFRAF
jgi:hypothetical protein